MTSKEIHENMCQILAKASPSYAIAKKQAAEFKQNCDSTVVDLWSGCPKPSITDEQVHAIHHMIWMTELLLSSRWLTL